MSPAGLAGAMPAIDLAAEAAASPADLALLALVIGGAALWLERRFVRAVGSGRGACAGCSGCASGAACPMVPRFDTASAPEGEKPPAPPR